MQDNKFPTQKKKSRNPFLIPQTSGVYLIKCVTNDHFYIGQSLNCYKRWHQHLYKLKRNEHGNDRLQKVFNKYGEINLEIRMIQACDGEWLDRIESLWLDKYFSNPNCMNLSNSARNKNGSNITEQTRERMSLARKQYYKSPRDFSKRMWDDGRKQNMSEKFSGQKNPQYGISPPNKLTLEPENDNNISKLYLSGKSLIKVSKETGFSVTTVINSLNRTNTPIRDLKTACRGRQSERS